MPEAVIVATARSPIGRAVKGSLKDMRPDDLAVQMVRAALAKVPELDPTEIDDLMLGCGQPAGESGNNLARVVAVLAGMDHLPGTTVNRYCSSSLQTTRMAMHAIRAGEGDVFISAGVETVSRYVKGRADGLPDTQNPVFAEAQARTEKFAAGGQTWVDPRTEGSCPTSTSRWGRRRRTSPSSGHDPRRSRTSSASAARTGREGDRGRVLGARDHAGDAARTGPGQRRRRPARRGRRSRRSPASSRCSAPTAR